MFRMCYISNSHYLYGIQNDTKAYFLCNHCKFAIQRIQNLDNCMLLMKNIGQTPNYRVSLILIFTLIKGEKRFAQTICEKTCASGREETRSE